MSVKTHGTWGTRYVTRRTPTSLTAVLYLKPNKRCSFHEHKHAYNQFFVVSGKIGVKTNIGPGEQSQIEEVTQGQTFTVQPGIAHEFMTYGLPAVIEEIAYVKYDTGDIYRMKLGGDLPSESA